MTRETIIRTPELVNINSEALRRAILANQQLSHEIDAQINTQVARNRMLTPQGRHLVMDHLEQAQNEAADIAERHTSWLESLSSGYYVKLDPSRHMGNLSFLVTSGDMNPEHLGDIVKTAEVSFFLGSFKIVPGFYPYLGHLVNHYEDVDNGTLPTDTIVLQPPRPFI